MERLIVTDAGKFPHLLNRQRVGAAGEGEDRFEVVAVKFGFSCHWNTPFGEMSWLCRGQAVGKQARRFALHNAGEDLAELGVAGDDGELGDRFALGRRGSVGAQALLQERHLHASDEGDGYLTLPLLSDDTTMALVQLMNAQGVGVLRLEERQKSLEDIFLELTGKAVSL